MSETNEHTEEFDTPPFSPSPPPEPIPGFAMPPDGVMEQVYAAKPPSPPRAGATLPDDEREDYPEIVQNAYSDVYDHIDGMAGDGCPWDHSIPRRQRQPCPQCEIVAALQRFEARIRINEHAATRTALLAELAARAGEEVTVLVDAFGAFLPRGWRDDPRFIEARTALLAHVAALAAERDEAVRDLEAARFAPLGDNHHNAMACPYCNPQRLTPAPVSAPASTEREVLARITPRWIGALKEELDEACTVGRNDPDYIQYEQIGQTIERRHATILAAAIRALGPGDAPAREGKDV